MTPEQSRMARAALNCFLTDLAREAGMGRATAARFELGQVFEANRTAAMRSTPEGGGVHFLRWTGRVSITVPE